MSKSALALFGATLLAMAGSANASVFYIDQFTVTENGQTYWNDTFSDGAPPMDRDIQNPAPVDTNLYGRAYLTRPYDRLPGPETGGKLALDTAQGYPNIGVVTPVPNLIQRARVNAATDTNNPASLLASEAINVTGLFDLIEPQLNHELYSIRLTDWAGGTTPEGVELAVLKTGAGKWVVQLRQAIIQDHWNPLQTWDLASITGIGGYEQIALSLFNDPGDLSGGTDFTAQFELIDLDNPALSQTFTSSARGVMYQYLDWLRPEFTARLRVALPEPGILALFLVGIAAVGIARRKAAGQPA